MFVGVGVGVAAMVTVLAFHGHGRRWKGHTSRLAKLAILEARKSCRFRSQRPNDEATTSLADEGGWSMEQSA